MSKLNFDCYMNEGNSNMLLFNNPDVCPKVGDWFTLIPLSEIGTDMAKMIHPNFSNRFAIWEGFNPDPLVGRYIITRNLELRKWTGDDWILISSFEYARKEKGCSL